MNWNEWMQWICIGAFGIFAALSDMNITVIKTKDVINHKENEDDDT